MSATHVIYSNGMGDIPDNPALGSVALAIAVAECTEKSKVWLSAEEINTPPSCFSLMVGPKLWTDGLRMADQLRATGLPIVCAMDPNASGYEWGLVSYTFSVGYARAMAPVVQHSLELKASETVSKIGVAGGASGEAAAGEAAIPASPIDKYGEILEAGESSGQ